MTVGEGLAPPVYRKVSFDKKYGDLVKCYEVAVLCFSMAAFYRREGQAPPLQYDFSKNN